ncbi:alpha/beta fold hydrolase [Aeromicrobium chenweiae]|uniref:Alpha/beta hydrolase n=1 Tax=Aeromicrobium chenweiae TaxID=2079793 RepID=A0A2S0WMM9_9ACTN|nr:alpha/beta hydrolase [Aeromicrobium chenweiae]AWB92598.1 alpha/beta hydrolase [Aeromicrobium chenweiae]TGN33585.1 alpha/beta hydrolase [Aeromicrobium chenweiae]
MRTTRQSLAFAAAGAVAIGAIVAGINTANASTTDTATNRVVKEVKTKPTSAKKPTIVLVHGAFADGSGWNGTIERLRKDNYPVIAFANPLQGPTYDVATLKSFLKTIDGPVILVGHSYGGALISGAGAGNSHVKGLVYVTAYAPDKGESVGEVNLHPVAHPNPELPLVKVPFKNSAGQDDALLYIEPAKFPAFFAADVRSTLAKNMAASQRPVANSGFDQPIQAAAWRSIPSWYLVAKQDKALNPELQRYMAKRAHAHTVESNGSHAVMVSRPGTVTKLIEAADRGTR